jgi:hypothetical protein
VRNFWLYAFKNCAWSDVARAAWTLGRKALLGAAAGGGHASEATGTIGLDESLKATPGGLAIAIKATLNALLNLPYCLKRRRVCRAPDFRLPVE